MSMLKSAVDEVKKIKESLVKKVKDVLKSITNLHDTVNLKLGKVSDSLVKKLSSLSSAVADAAEAIRKSITGMDKKRSKLTGTSSNRKFKVKKTAQPEGVKQISGPGASDRITISSDKGNKGKGKYRVNKDKLSATNISVGKKFPAKRKQKQETETRSKRESNPPSRRKPRKKTKSQKVPQSTPDTRRRKSKSRSGRTKATDKKPGYGQVADFNKVVGQITSIQKSVSGVITAVDKVAETGDLTPLVNELSNIPGPLGQIASVTSQSFKIGNQMYELYMKRLGGQEKYNKDLKAKQDYINNSKFKTTEDTNNARKDNVFRGYINYLRKNNLATEKELVRLVKQYFHGANKNERGAAYTEAGTRTRDHQRQTDDKKRLGKEYDKLEKQEQKYEADSAKRNKDRQDSIASGKFKAGSDKDYETKQQNILKDKEELQKLLGEAKKIGAGSKIKDYQALIKAQKQDFEKVSELRDKAAVERDNKRKIKGQMTEDELKTAREKRARTLMQIKALSLNKHDDAKELEKKKIALINQSDKENKVIRALEEKLAAEKSGGAASGKVAMSSDCGKKLDDLKTMLDTELSEGNIKKSVDKILEELRKYYSHSDKKVAKTENETDKGDKSSAEDVKGASRENRNAVDLPGKDLSSAPGMLIADAGKTVAGSEGRKPVNTGKNADNPQIKHLVNNSGFSTGPAARTGSALDGSELEKGFSSGPAARYASGVPAHPKLGGFKTGPAARLKAALGSTRNRLALDPGKARSTINLPATASTQQQSTNAVHQTLKKVKEILDHRLPSDYF